MPPFAYWSPDQMKNRTGTDSDMIRDHMLGWDITDYGLGKFDELGLFLFTVRNGNQANVKDGKGMLYAEKIMISGENQISPMHRHNLKTEDIINKGRGTLTPELFKAIPDGNIDENAPSMCAPTAPCAPRSAVIV
jgi:D-lyxose ketol-isomerase